MLTKSGRARWLVKILVGGLTLDRVLVEAAEVMYDALLALARRSVNP